MAGILFSEEHEWVEMDGDIATVGISEFAQEQLGDIVFVELPEIGATVTQGDEAGVVESVKAASEIYSPISGEVTEVNEALEGTPELVNEDAQGDGWLFKVRVSDADELDNLMDEKAYKAFCKEHG